MIPELTFKKFAIFLEDPDVMEERLNARCSICRQLILMMIDGLLSDISFFII